MKNNEILDTQISVVCPECGRFCTDLYVHTGNNEFKNMKCRNCPILGFDLVVNVKTNGNGEPIYYHQTTVSGNINQMIDYHQQRIDRYSK